MIFKRVQLGLAVAFIATLVGGYASPALAANGNSNRQSIISRTQFYDPNDTCEIDLDNPDVIQGKDNIMKVMNFFVAKGLKPYMAAGIVGNLTQESSLDPTAQQDGSNDKLPKSGVGFGLAQWTFSARQKPLLALAAQRGHTTIGKITDATDIGLQLGYLWEELSGDSSTEPPAGDFSFALRALRDTTDVDSATTIFEQKFEVAGDPQMPKRIAYAKTALKEYVESGGVVDPAVDGGAGATLPGTNACGGAAGAETAPGSAADCGNAAAGNARILACALTFDPYLYDWGGGHGGAKSFMTRFNAGVKDGSIKKGVTPVLDCSGLVGVSTYMAFGIDDVRTSNAYGGSKYWKAISISQAKAGDIVTHPGHVAIVVTNGGTNKLTVFAARTANDTPARQLDYTRNSKYRDWGSGTFRYIGPGSTP